MASDKSHVYYVSNMAGLQNIVQSITKQSCTGNQREGQISVNKCFKAMLRFLLV